MCRWVATDTRVPVSDDITSVGADYYLVRLENYRMVLAMFLEGEWYTSYISKIIVPVIAWLEEKADE